ncbi:hypothetical protein CPLU01_07855 [Colletotrichum plurivorum]|uniref:Uncharacterized protein n=1 Tax=Colletotrichum plurivorum TaxID=2175906 RepID=A0A8H6KDG3_9PEZI|nr:hypothetical protein CPLU01_07855 [Colletotrichum plurivorum]
MSVFEFHLLDMDIVTNDTMSEEQTNEENCNTSAAALHLIDMDMGIATDDQANVQRGLQKSLDPSFEVSSDASIEINLHYPADPASPSSDSMWDDAPQDYEPTSETLVEGPQVPKRPKLIRRNQETFIIQGDRERLVHSPTADLMRGSPQTNHTLVNGLRVSKPLKATSNDQEDIAKSTKEMAHLFYSPTAELMRGSPPANHTLSNGLRIPKPLRRPRESTDIHPLLTEDLMQFDEDLMQFDEDLMQFDEDLMQFDSQTDQL